MCFLYVDIINTFLYYSCMMLGKRENLFLLIFYNVAILCFPQSNNYSNGNGTIIEKRIDGNTEWIIRKHIEQIQVKDFNIFDFPNFANNIKNINIFTFPKTDSEYIIYKLKLDDCINTIQIAEGTTDNNNYVWLNIKINNEISGWIFLGNWTHENAVYCVPYFGNRWEIIDVIKTKNKNWTVRKMMGQINSVWEVLNIRDKPGLFDSNIIGKIIPPINKYGYYEIIDITIEAMTEETDEIDQRTDSWLKITYNGISGWIFGGYTGVERGGAKYYTPDSIIFRGIREIILR